MMGDRERVKWLGKYMKMKYLSSGYEQIFLLFWFFGSTTITPSSSDVGMSFNSFYFSPAFLTIGIFQPDVTFNRLTIDIPRCSPLAPKTSEAIHIFIDFSRISAAPLREDVFGIE